MGDPSGEKQRDRGGGQIGRVGVAVEQRLGRYDEARRANPALQRRVLEELLLQGV